MVKNPISVSEELDFFADMQPVIQTNQQVMTPHDKFAPILGTNSSDSFTNREFRIYDFFNEYLLRFLFQLAK